MKPERVIAACTLLVSPVLSSSAFGQTPVGTAFTYQGSLADAGSPATGSYDFQFTLNDTAIGGVRVRPTGTRTGVNATNGLFTVSLDFGAVFAGSKRWLEIGVKPAGSPNPLAIPTPREELTPAPNAQYASMAGGVMTGGAVRSLSGQTDVVTLAATNGLSVSPSAGTVTVTTNATASNSASTIVSRDGTGGFAAGTITAAGGLLSNSIDRATAGSLSIGATSATSVTITPDTVVTGTLRLGGGAAMSSVLTATAALNFPSTVPQSGSDLTIIATGAVAGASVALGIPGGSILADSCYTAWVSSVSTVTVRFNNYSAAVQDPASGTFRATVIQF